MTNSSKERENQESGENNNKTDVTVGMSLRKRAKPIPMLRNGNCKSLKSVQIDQRRISLHDTCGFDSLLQILISAGCDWSQVSENMTSQKGVNELFEMVPETLQFGLKRAYRQRARILQKYFPVQKVVRGCDIVQCESNIGHLCNTFFANTPSVIELTTCDKGCPSRVISIPVIAVEDSKITDPNFADAIYNQLNIGERQCSNADCVGLETTLVIPGAMIVVEVYNLCNDINPVRINKLLKTIKGPNSLKNYQLMGLVEYKAPPKRKGKVDDVGHYIAVCNRIGGMWLEYDDAVQAAVKRSAMHKVNVALLVYAHLE